MKQFAMNLGGDSGDANPSPTTGESVFEDFTWGNLTQANVPQGAIGIVTSGNAGGGGDTLANTAQEAGRPGIACVQTGTTSNATGQGFFYTDTCLLYPGDGTTTTLQWAAKTPVLSDVTNEYVIEMGFGGFKAAAPADNGMIISYKRTTSTNWMAFTSNNGSQNPVTTADATNFAVAASTWYNFKIIYSVALVSFYVAKIGQPFVLLGTSASNLPTASFASSLYFSIYRASTFALKRQLKFDWVKWDTITSR